MPRKTVTKTGSVKAASETKPTKPATGLKKKDEEARGLRVRPTGASIEAIMRETPRVEWDDSLGSVGTAGSGGAKQTGSTSGAKQAGGAKQSGSGLGVGQQGSGPSIGQVPGAPQFHSRLKANWIGVDATATAQHQPMAMLPSIELTDENGKTSIRLRKGSEFMRLGEWDGKAGLWIGMSDALPGRLVVRAGNQEGRIVLDSADSSLSIRAPGGGLRGRLFPTANGCAVHMFDQGGRPFAYLGDFDKYSGLLLGGAGQFAGRIELYKGNYDRQIVLDADTGDITLANADCAEEFDVSDPAAEAGTVLVLDDEPGRLRPSDAAYDTRVAGVISGAGDYRPGIVLDRKAEREGRRPVALVGKVFCRVEADSTPIRAGSLLTTSAKRGYAMAVVDRERAFGAVLGKALAGLDRGCGLVPVLVALQ